MWFKGTCKEYTLQTEFKPICQKVFKCDFMIPFLSGKMCPCVQTFWSCGSCKWNIKPLYMAQQTFLLFIHPKMCCPKKPLIGGVAWVYLVLPKCRHEKSSNISAYAFLGHSTFPQIESFKFPQLCIVCYFYYYIQ